MPTLGSVVLLAYAAILIGVAWSSRRRIRNVSDYLVAGRRLGVPLASAGLLATWFGAGTLLAAADEVRAEGLRAAALEPIGPGICLLLVGLFYAGPLRRARLLTLCDYFGRRFGRRAEWLSAAIMVPSFFGWIAAQFTVLAALLAEAFGFSLAAGLLCGAVFAVAYTMIGGMWSVTLTDAAQLVVVAAGLAAMGVAALTALGDGAWIPGALRLGGETPSEVLAFIPAEGAERFAWVGLLLAGALGNIPGQDVMQRVLAARTAAVARRACLIAGAAYLALGAVPLTLGLAARLLLPGVETDVFPALAGVLFSPLATLGITLVIVSALLSTADSALMSAASVLSRNLLRHRLPRVDPLRLSRLAVLLVGAASLLLALGGASAYTLLEAAYELTLVGLFVPLTLGLFWRGGGPRAGIAAMAVGTLLWAGHQALGWETFAAPLGGEFPSAVGMTLASAAAYLAGARFDAPGRSDRARMRA